MGRKFFGIKILVAFVAIWCFGIATVNDANAAVMSADSINKLGVMRGVRQCYANAKPLIKKINFNGSETVFGRTYKNKDAVEMPTNVGNSLDYNHFILKCKKIIDDDKTGFQKYYTFPDTLEGYGYELNSTDNSGGGNRDEAFVTITLISHNYGSDTNDTKVIIPENESKILCHGKRESAGWGGTKYRWVVDYCDGTITAKYNNAILLRVGTETTSGNRDGFPVWTDDGDVSSHLQTRFAPDANYINEYLSDTLMDGLDAMENDKRKDENFSLLTAINDSSFFSNLQNYFIESAIPKYGANPGLELVLTQTNKENTDTENEYRLTENNYWVAADKMLSTVGIDESLPTSSYEMGGVTYRHYYWNNAARYSLYYYYLLNKMEQYPNDITIGHCSSTKPNKYAFKNKSNEWCKINIEYGVQGEVLSKQDYNMVSILVDGQLDLVQGYFVDVLEWFDNENSYSNLAESQYADATISNDGGVVPSDSGTSTSSSGNQCWESNIDSMAWVMCPAEANLKEFANGMGKYIDNWLQVDSDIYKNGSPAQIAWGYVRTIANTLMILFMGVIIFSQLTGFGIDNYGIKKLLPKFIVMAVLVNLSFFICQLAVDLSNIAGNGIQGLFYGIGNNIISAAGVDASKAFSEGFVEAITKAIYAISVAGPGIIGTGLTIYSAYLGGGTAMAVILVLLMLLTIIAGILMFFVSLGARMVILIACMILAPLALVCYILPNTKPAYKKWFDAFKAALIIYPICGFTVGISYIVKAIVLTQAEPPIWMVVVSGIVPYLPFFMIPTMLKGVISAIGSIGAALSTVGSTFKSGAGKMQSTLSDSIKNSDRWKNATRLTSERRTNMRAGISEKTGNLTKAGKLHAKFANSKIGQFVGEDRLQAARIAAAKKNLETGQEAQAALTGAVADVEISKNKTNAAGFNAGTREAFYAKQYLEAARSSNINDMNAAILAMNKSGMKKKDIAKVIRYAENNGYLNGFNSDARSAFYRNMVTNRDNAGFLATDFELSQFATKGGNGTLGDYGSYAKNNIGPDDFKPEDGGSLSGDSMAGLAAAGIINQSMAQSILANNPNLSADKKVMLSAVASGRANITDAEKFKEEAKAVLGTDGKPAGGVIAGMSVDKSTVEAWTSALPKDVNVVQNFKAGGQQYAPVAVEGQSYRVDHLSDETLLDMATQPGVNMDNPLRTAAETEYNRRQNQQQPPKNNP